MVCARTAGSRKPTATLTVSQRVHVVLDEEAKWATFVGLLEPLRPQDGSRVAPRVLVFANTKRTVREIGGYCWGQGYDCDTLSGARTQASVHYAARSLRAVSCLYSMLAQYDRRACSAQ